MAPKASTSGNANPLAAPWTALRNIKIRSDKEDSTTTVFRKRDANFDVGDIMNFHTLVKKHLEFFPTRNKTFNDRFFTIETKQLVDEMMTQRRPAQVTYNSTWNVTGYLEKRNLRDIQKDTKLETYLLMFDLLTYSWCLIHPFVAMSHMNVQDTTDSLAGALRESARQQDSLGNVDFRGVPGMVIFDYLTWAFYKIDPIAKKYMHQVVYLKNSDVEIQPSDNAPFTIRVKSLPAVSMTVECNAQGVVTHVTYGSFGKYELKPDGSWDGSALPPSSEPSHVLFQHPNGSKGLGFTHPPVGPSPPVNATRTMATSQKEHVHFKVKDVGYSMDLQDSYALLYGPAGQPAPKGLKLHQTQDGKVDKVDAFTETGGSTGTDVNTAPVAADKPELQVYKVTKKGDNIDLVPAIPKVLEASPPDHTPLIFRVFGSLVRVGTKDGSPLPPNMKSVKLDTVDGKVEITSSGTQAPITAPLQEVSEEVKTPLTHQSTLVKNTEGSNTYTVEQSDQDGMAISGGTYSFSAFDATYKLFMDPNDRNTIEMSSDSLANVKNIDTLVLQQKDENQYEYKLHNVNGVNVDTSLTPDPQRAPSAVQMIRFSLVESGEGMWTYKRNETVTTKIDGVQTQVQVAKDNSYSSNQVSKPKSFARVYGFNTEKQGTFKVFMNHVKGTVQLSGDAENVKKVKQFVLNKPTTPGGKHTAIVNFEDKAILTVTLDAQAPGTKLDGHIVEFEKLQNAPGDGNSVSYGPNLKQAATGTNVADGETYPLVDFNVTPSAATATLKQPTYYSFTVTDSEHTFSVSSFDIPGSSLTVSSAEPSALKSVSQFTITRNPSGGKIESVSITYSDKSSKDAEVKQLEQQPEVAKASARVFDVVKDDETKYKPSLLFRFKVGVEQFFAKLRPGTKELEVKTDGKTENAVHTSVLSASGISMSMDKAGEITGVSITPPERSQAEGSQPSMVTVSDFSPLSEASEIEQFNSLATVQSKTFVAPATQVKSGELNFVPAVSPNTIKYAPNSLSVGDTLGHQYVLNPINGIKYGFASHPAGTAQLVVLSDEKDPVKFPQHIVVEDEPLSVYFDNEYVPVSSSESSFTVPEERTPNTASYAKVFTGVDGVALFKFMGSGETKTWTEDQVTEKKYRFGIDTTPYELTLRNVNYSSGTQDKTSESFAILRTYHDSKLPTLFGAIHIDPSLTTGLKGTDATIHDIEEKDVNKIVLSASGGNAKEYSIVAWKSNASLNATSASTPIGAPLIFARRKNETNDGRITYVIVNKQAPVDK